MAQNDQNVGSDVTVTSLRTETNIKMLEIRSTIKNVSKLPYGKKVIGSDFYLASKCMCCVIFQKGHIDLNVYICNKSAAEIKIERALVLYDCNNKKLHENKDEEIFSLKKDKPVDVIGKVENRSRFDSLTIDTLIIEICVNIKEIAGMKTNCLNSYAESEGRLREDFQKMLENPVNSDVSLLVGEERIPAHWSVLCSRSPYFKKMFESEMKERVKNSVSITDISVATVRHLIKFLYTAYFFDNDESVDMEELFELYYSADKYEVMDLRTLCAGKIITNASADNVWQIFMLAYRHDDKELATGFLKSRSDEVFQSDGWKKFEAKEPLIAEAFVLCLKNN